MSSPHRPQLFANPHRLYVSDLDGTLLDRNSQISSLAREDLIKIITEQRKAFTIASARSHTTIAEILGDLPFVIPIIQLNGALITDYHSREDFHQVFLSEKEVITLLDIFKDYRTCFLVSAKEHHGNINRCLIPSHRNKAMEWFYQERRGKRDPRIWVIAESSYVMNYRPISFTVIESHERSAEIFQIINRELGENMEIYPMGVDREGWEWTTIQHAEANKGRAVEKLCETFNFHPEQVTVFGDNVNDLSMFKKPFKGVAVGNAHPVIKSHAQNIIGNHWDNSVVKYVHDE